MIMNMLQIYLLKKKNNTIISLPSGSDIMMAMYQKMYETFEKMDVVDDTKSTTLA